MALISEIIYVFILNVALILCCIVSMRHDLFFISFIQQLNVPKFK